MLAAPVTFQFASDLHLEALLRTWPDARIITPHPKADALILAGDIACIHDIGALFGDWPVPVFHVPGNHEYYGLDMAHERRQLRRTSKVGAVQVLDDAGAVFKGVRILGSTLWTDYRLHPALGLPAAKAAAQVCMVGADFAAIRHEGHLLGPAQVLELHAQSAAWLREELGHPFTGPTLVVTHHAPSRASLPPRWAHTSSAVAFASDLPHLLSKATAWVHGHLHNAVEHRAYGCLVLANPRGYARALPLADRPEDLSFENPDFEPARLVTLWPGSRRVSTDEE